MEHHKPALRLLSDSEHRRRHPRPPLSVLERVKPRQRRLLASALKPTSFGFGAPQTSAAAPNFGFGTAQSSTAAPSFGFGAPQASSAAPAFGFGTSQTQTAAPSFSFGAPQTSAAPAFGFGAPATSTAGNLFGGTGAFGGFGTSAAPLGGLSTTQASFGMFGSGLGQQPQQAVQQQQQQSGVDAVIYSTVYCNVYGDERDAVLSRWNVLQAAWGTGKGSLFTNTFRGEQGIL